ncbi:MAG TPA: hypothetical protein VNG69_05615 [Casimicrobiaceae bacterium]|nr:hypothetical protein [Casimicrobiaceae bacterium]
MNEPSLTSEPSDTAPTMVTGVFSDAESVERAYRAAEKQGYSIDDLNVVMSDETRQRYFSQDQPISTELASKSAEGGELGGPTGGRIGIALSIVAAVGAALVLPGLGLVMAGPVAVALAGAGSAAVAATLIGALSDWGLPEERVKHYDDAIKNGGILMALKTRSPDDARDIESQWRDFGAAHLHAQPEASG